MTRIVTSTYRYKRPPRRKKAVALAGPQIVAIPRKQRSKIAGEMSPATSAHRGQKLTAEPPANDDRKSAIVTTVSRKRSRLRRIEQALARRASSGDSSE
jgi:hypothetical protein